MFIKKNIHSGRLFTVGIGSAPNHFFMRKAARVGRGTFLHIGDVSEVEDKMNILFRKLACPVLTDLSLSWSNSSAEILPDPVPDLYSGEPLTICTSSYLEPGDLFISGSYGNQSWYRSFTYNNSGKKTGIGKLWARRKIEKLMDQRFDGTDEDEIKNEVINIALTHHLVTEYTSLVAVEHIMSKPAEVQSGKEKLPLKLPEGWEMGQSNMNLPATGTGMWLFLSTGFILICIFLIYLISGKWKMIWVKK